MSLAQKTNLDIEQTLERKRGEYGLILALLGIAVALVIASAISPVSFGEGINDEIALVGP